MASQLILPHLLDANGDPVAGGKAYVYETGTTTPVTVYTDTGLSVAHANPIVADSAGRFAQAFYGGSTALKVVLTTSADATVDTLDPVALVPVTSSSASAVTYAPVTGNAATNIQDAVDNLVDGTATFQAFTSVSGGVIDTADIVDGAVTEAKLAAPPAQVFLARRTASASATLSFTEFDATKYSSYLFVIENLKATTGGGRLSVRTSTDGGSTYDSGASDYRFTLVTVDHTASPTVSATGDIAENMIWLTGLFAGAATTGICGAVRIVQPDAASYTNVQICELTWENGASSGTALGGGGYRISAADVDAVQFLINTGDTFASGSITMYGLRSS